MASIRRRTWITAAGETRTRWQAAYADQTGKRCHRQFKTRKAADDFMTGARYEVKQGTHTAPSASITVAKAVEQWLEHGEAEGLDAMTLRTYRSIVRWHVTPILGPAKLATLTRPALEAYRDDLLAGRVPDGKPRSRHMARVALQCLKAAIKEAMRRGQVAQNVAVGVQVKSNRSEGAEERKEIGIDVPDKVEIRAMLEAVAPRWRPLFVVAVFTGLRASELRGLTWQNVDLKAKVLKVRQRADRWQQLGPPKSKAGRRDVPLAPMALNALREWKLACPPSELDLVFPTLDGRVLDHSSLARYAFGAVQRQAGIVDQDGRPKYGPHDFRHFTASWLIGQGFGPKKIMTILGHADIAMTFNIYGHMFELNEADHDRLAAGELALVGG
jgi:integrase